MKPKDQLKYGAMLSYCSIALNIVAGLLYTPWMIEQIGRSQYGLFTLANSLITLFLIDFGLSSATARYVSKYIAEGRQDRVDYFLGAIYQLYMVLDAVIFLVLLVIYLFLDRIYVKLTPAELETFKVVYLISAGFSVLNFPFVTLNGILTSYERFIPLKSADVLYRLMVVGFTVMALLQGLGLYALVAVNALCGLVITGYKLLAVKRGTPVRVKFGCADRALYRDIFSFSLWVTAGTVAQRLVFTITPSILGMTVDSAAIAVFGVVMTIEGYTYTVTGAINGMFMPKIARMYTEDDGLRALNRLAVAVGKFQFLLNALIVVGFAAVGRDFIRLWVGEGFRQAYAGILLVSIPGLFYNALQIANTAMVVQKKVRQQALITIVTGLVNLCLCPILSLRFGVIGACVSIFLAYTVRAALCHRVYRRMLQLDIAALAKECYLKAVPPVAVTLAVGCGMNRLLDSVSWTAVAVKGTAVVLTFILSVVGAERLYRKAAERKEKREED